MSSDPGFVQLVRYHGNTCSPDVTERVLIPPHPYIAPSAPSEAPSHNGEKYDYICEYGARLKKLRETLSVKNAKAILLQIVYALKHLHTTRSGRHYTVGASLQRKNIRFSADKKHIVLAHFEAVPNGDINTDICQLHDIFEFVLDKCKTGDYDLDYWKQNKHDSSKMSNSIVSHLIDSTQNRSFQTVGDVLKHPFFWSTEKKVNFLIKVQDIGKTRERLEEDLENILGGIVWVNKLKLDKSEISNGCDTLAIQKLTKKGKAENEHKSAFYLLRFIRNVKAHYWDGDNKSVRDVLKSDIDGVYTFFMKKFPGLFCKTYVCSKRQKSPDVKRHFKLFLEGIAECYEMEIQFSDS